MKNVFVYIILGFDSDMVWKIFSLKFLLESLHWPGFQMLFLTSNLIHTFNSVLLILQPCNLCCLKLTTFQISLAVTASLCLLLAILKMDLCFNKMFWQNLPWSSLWQVKNGGGCTDIGTTAKEASSVKNRTLWCLKSFYS